MTQRSEEEVRARLRKIEEWATTELEHGSQFVRHLDCYTHGSAGYEQAQEEVQALLTDALESL